MPYLKRSPIALPLLAAGLVMACIAGLVAAPASSQAGWTAPSFLDTTFNPDSNGVVNRVLVQSDGKILMGGAFTTVGGETRGRVARLNADGTIDNAFANPAFNGVVRSMAIQSNGKILVGGEFTEVGGQTRNKIARLNADGTLDTSFDIGTITGTFGGQPIVHAIAVQADGKIMVGGTFGSFTAPGGSQIIRFASARLNADGTVDTSYASPIGAGDRAWTVEVLSGGKILIGAQSGTAANRLVLANSDGTRDLSFVNPNPNEQVFDLAVQSDGKILAGGLFTSIAGETRNRLARLNADGSLDTGFNPNVNGGVESVSLRADGKILIGGSFTQVGGTARARVGIVNTDGTVNAAFFATVGSVGSNVYSAVSQADGNILIGGNFTTVEGQTRNRVARVFPELPPAAPANTSPPTVSGTAEVGQTLAVDDIGDWTGYPEPDFTYQWERCVGAGTNWVSRNSAADNNWFGVTWGDPPGPTPGQFVAVSNNGTGNRVMTSEDGVTWTTRTSAANNEWNSVAWGGPEGQEKFVAVAITGSGNRVMTSPDGINWTARTSAADNEWRSVTWGGPGGQEKFVAVARTGTGNRVMTSPDGITWTAQTPASNNDWVAVTWGDPPGNTPGQFVAISTNGSGNRVMTSQDGVSWTARTSAADRAWNSVTWGGLPGDEAFVAVATFDGSGTQVMSSPDGINWTGHDAATVGDWRSVTWGDPAGEEKFVAVSFSGTGNRVMTSDLTCTDISGADDPSYTLTGADEGKKVRVKVTATNDEGSTSANSAPTATVDPAPVPANTDPPSISGETEVPQTLTADKGTWTGDPTFEYQWQRCTGDPGVKWTARTSATQSIWTSVAWGGPPGQEKFVATGLSGAVMTSPDGVNWTTRTPASPKNWISVTWGGPPGDEKFVAVADSGTGNRVMTSPDGINWTAQASTADNNWYGVTWGGPAGQAKFVAVAASGTGNRVMTSPDGINWTARTSAADNNWVSVTWGGPAGQEKFVAVAFTGTGNRVMTSPDGVTWTAQTSAADNDWISVTWGGPEGQEKFVAVGASGTGNRVMTSPDGISWTSQASPADNAWTSVVWGGPEGEEQFVAVADNGSAERVMTSPDGIEWTLQDPAADSGWRGLVWGGPFGDEKFVAVANSGAGSRVMTSGLDCVDITGATEEEYNLTADDVDARIRVKVTATNDAGTTVAYSDLTDPIDPEPLYPPENTELPTTEGSAGIGASLSADKGTWTGNPAPTYAYQWQRCDETGVYCDDIEGATSDSYTQTRDDVGKKIRVKVTGSNAEGSASAFSAPTEIVPGVPANTTPPSISGDPKAGETLTAEPGEWSAYPDPTFTYQWQRCNADGTNCVDINGATGETYDPTAADTGKKIRVKVTATNDEGEATVNTAPVGPVAGPPANTTPPTISGNPAVGSTLTADPGTWSGQPAPTFAYQWVVCNEDGTDCAPIAGATARTYTLTAAETGKLLFVLVTASNSEGEAEANSAPTSVIQPKPAPSGKPKLKVTVKTPKKVKAGKRFTIKVKTTNRAKAQTTRSTAASTPSTTARKVKTCVKLPAGIFVVNARGGKVSGRTVCWTRNSLAAGRSVGYSVVVRSSSSDSGSASISATARAKNSSGATAKAKAKAKLDVVKPKPKPKPKPPTG